MTIEYIDRLIALVDLDMLERKDSIQVIKCLEELKSHIQQLDRGSVVWKIEI